MHKEWVILNKQTEETLTRWWGKLNGWKWVKELGKEEQPSDWQTGGRREALIKLIERLVSRKTISKICATKIRKDMTEKEFEIWWVRGHSPDPKVREKYLQERMKDYKTK